MGTFSKAVPFPVLVYKYEHRIVFHKIKILLLYSQTPYKNGSHKGLQTLTAKPWQTSCKKFPNNSSILPLIRTSNYFCVNACDRISFDITVDKQKIDIANTTRRVYKIAR